MPRISRSPSSIRCEIVQDNRARIERNEGRNRRIGGVGRTVPTPLLGGYDVALCRFEERKTLDLIADLAFHDEPELGPVDMEMALIGDRRDRLGLAPQDVGGEVIVPNELAVIGLVAIADLLPEI